MVKLSLAMAMTGLALLERQLTMTNEYSEKLPEVVNEYIDAVVRQVKYRKKVRAEVREELEAHFLDALAGSETEQERQKRAEALIAGFGDVKVLARLIRRGKKRCRPLWRTLVVRAFQLVGVLFMLLVLYIGWFFSGKPIITTNYLEKLNTQVRPVADESMNAQPYYEQALKAYVSPETAAGWPGAANSFDMSPRKYSTLTAEERQVLRQWVEANHKTIELIKQGNEEPYYWRAYTTATDSSEMVSIYLPHLQDIRQAARLLCWNAIFAAEDGRFEQAFDSLLECYSLGKHLKVKAILIEQLVAIAIEGISMQTTRQMLDEYAGRIDAADLGRARARLEQMISSEDFTMGFEGEKYFLYDEIQRSFTQTRIGGSHIYIQRLGQLMPLLGNSGENEWMGTWFKLLFTHPDRQETLTAADAFYDALDRYAQLSPAQLREKGIDINKEVNEVVKGNLLLGMLTPALEQAIARAYQNRADSAATLAILAIIQYQKVNGRLPESLRTLAASGLLKDVPTDPYSEGPLVYRKTDDTFTLYSVGPDFTDDGGASARDDDGHVRRWADTGDMVFWPVTSD